MENVKCAIGVVDRKTVNLGLCCEGDALRQAGNARAVGLTIDDVSREQD